MTVAVESLRLDVAAAADLQPFVPTHNSSITRARGDVDAANDRVPSRHPTLVAREATTTPANGAVEIERMMRRHVRASATMRTRAREWPDERVNA